MRARDHVAERTQISFAQPALQRGEHAGDFPAAAENFGVCQRVLALRDPGDGDFSARQPFDVLLIVFGRDQFVVAAGNEFEEIAQELADVSGANEVLQVKIANATAQVDPEVLLIKNTKIFAAALQQVQAVIVEGGGVNGFAGEQGAHAISHFSRRITGVGKRQDFVRLRMTFSDEVFDAMRQDGGLAGARSCDYQHGAMDMLDGLALTLVGNERTGTRLLGRHCGSGYHLRG